MRPNLGSQLISHPEAPLPAPPPHPHPGPLTLLSHLSPGPAVPVSLAYPRPVGEMFVLLATLLVTSFLFHTGPQEEKLAGRHPFLSLIACSAASVGPQPPRPAASGKCLVLTDSSRCPVVAVALSFSEDSFFSLYTFCPSGQPVSGF